MDPVLLAAKGAATALFLYFLAAVFVRAKRYGPLPPLGALVTRELSSVRDPVGLMHLSIVASILLSMVLLWAFWAPLWYLSLAFAAGLAVALWWRVEMLRHSAEIHRALGVSREFAAASVRKKASLMAIIALSLAALLLFGLSEPAAAAVVLLRNVAVALYFVEPTANMLAASGRPLTDFRMPFDMREVLEGKVSPDSIKFGYAKAEDVEPQVRLNCQACGEIGACEAVCPAVASGRLLSPRVLVRTVALAKPGEELAVKLADAAWACTTCGACAASCPIGVYHLDVVYGVRRALVAESKVDQRQADLLTSLSQYGNALLSPNAGRHDWLRELGVRTVAENPNFEYLLWVGCMGSFDQRARRIVEALVKVLKAAGMLDRVAVLGDEETCCGDPARRLGEESRFQEIALNNIELFRRYGVKKIITICPHGYNSFKNEYPRLGAQLEVIHHSQLLEQLVSQGKVKVRPDDLAYAVHDPCYLARYNGVVKPQRVVVKAVGQPREPRRRGERTFCCGAGGANYWYEVPEKRRISHIRFDELASTGAKAIATMCPFCNAMLSEAARAKGREDVAVVDIAEAVASRLAD